MRLFDAGAVRLGDIEAKIGRRTPIYFDLRVVVSHPQIMVNIETTIFFKTLPHAGCFTCVVSWVRL